MEFQNQEARIISEDGTVLCTGVRKEAKGALYEIFAQEPKERVYHLETALESLSIMQDWHYWHEALGHANINKLKCLAQEKLITIDGNEPKNLDCIACLENKATINPRPKENKNRPKIVGARLQMDFWSISNLSHQKEVGTINVINAASRFTFCFPVKSKMEALNI